MITAAYCRYSSDQQRSASIRDQLRNIHAYCAREGWPEPTLYQDDAISGARVDRPGYQAMLQDAQRGRFDVLLVDDFSRIGRDHGETWQAMKLLKYAGVRVIGVSDGTDTGRKGHKLETGLRGLIAEQYLDDLAEKTHRGLTGQALAGYNAGGLPYGYRSAHDGNGYRLEPDPEQAEIVRWIYQRYADGHSPRAIADQLNRRGVPSPRGTAWAQSAIRADLKRGTGILGNPIYIGQQVWNRSKWVKDPITGKRKRQERPQAEWVTTEDAQLAILSQDLWNRVNARHRAIHEANLKKSQDQKRATHVRGAPKYLFSGLLTCAECGSRYIIIDRRNYGCARHKDRGPTACGNSLKVRREIIERALLADIKASLLTEDAYTAFERECRALLNQHQPDASQAKRQLQQATRERDNILSAIKAGIITPSTKQALEAAEAQITLAERELAEIQAYQPTQILPRAREIYQELIKKLENIKDIPAAREAIKAIIGEEIRIAPDNQGRPVAELQGGIQALEQISLVAGAGFVHYLPPRRVILE